MSTIISTGVRVAQPFNMDHVTPGQYIAVSRDKSLNTNTVGKDFIDPFSQEEFDTEEKTKKIAYGILLINPRIRVTLQDSGERPCVFGVMPIKDEYLSNKKLKQFIFNQISSGHFARFVYDDRDAITKIYIQPDLLSTDLPLAGIAYCFFSNREGYHPQTDRRYDRPHLFDMELLDARISEYSKKMFEKDLCILLEKYPPERVSRSQRVGNSVVNNCVVC